MNRGRSVRRRSRTRRGISTLEWILVVGWLVLALVGVTATLRYLLIGEYHGLTLCIEQVNVSDCARCEDELCEESPGTCPDPWWE